MALIRHVALRCSDMEKSKVFYQTVFGWELIDYRPSGRCSHSKLLCLPSNIAGKSPLCQSGSPCERLHTGVEGLWGYSNGLLDPTSARHVRTRAAPVQGNARRVGACLRGIRAMAPRSGCVRPAGSARTGRVLTNAFDHPSGPLPGQLCFTHKSLPSA